MLAPDGAEGDYLGSSVALDSDGTRALVSAPYDDIPGGAFQAGSARMFVRTGTTWTHEATLLAADGAPWDRFGGTVALSSDGDRALVAGDSLADGGGGVRDVGGADGSSGSPVAPPAGAGCSCRVPGRAPVSPVPLAAVGALLLVVRRRVSARRR